ncbi:UNVERIFIED_CONTAM: hypothetical protein Slati_1767800 [Sesamum latifolium]|uniref:Uncharacterized protein n=1 Tax=Sesamum latifolium TaxID=2727402 RepID=A0AAW2WZL3_9LAMI
MNAKIVGRLRALREATPQAGTIAPRVDAAATPSQAEGSSALPIQGPIVVVSGDTATQDPPISGSRVPPATVRWWLRMILGPVTLRNARGNISPKVAALATPNRPGRAKTLSPILKNEKPKRPRLVLKRKKI